MVPPTHMQMLYAKAAAHNSQCTFVEFPTGMHMDTWLEGGDRYWRTIQLFLEENVPEKKNDDFTRRGNGMYWISRRHVFYNCKPAYSNPTFQFKKTTHIKTYTKGNIKSWTSNLPARLMFQRSRIMFLPAKVMIYFEINHREVLLQQRCFLQTILLQSSQGHLNGVIIILK